MTSYSMHETHSLYLSPIPDYSARGPSKYSDMLTSVHTDDSWCGDSSGSPPSSSSSFSAESSPRLYDGIIPIRSELLQGLVGYDPHMPAAPFGSWNNDSLDVAPMQAQWHSSLLHLSFQQDDYPMNTFPGTNDYVGGLELDIPGTSSTISVKPEDSSTTLLNVDAVQIANPSAIYSPNCAIDTQNEEVFQFPDSDQDAEGETDEEDGFDYETDVEDKKLPESSLELVLRRSRRATRSASTAAPYSPARPARSFKSSSSSPERELSYGSLNTKPIETLHRLRQAMDSTPNYNAINAAGDFECQVCGYVCKRARKVDFRRHVSKHYRKIVAPSGPVLCCGIPITQRSLPKYRGKIPSDAVEMTFYDQQMVGGCGKLFSRTDALKRHLDLPHGRCFGDLAGDWHPPKPNQRN